ncbi:hypothetical protein P3X46_024921 [Hevea brasiliensis]|uniref:Btz domain-containing protein n=1 Tax=Hevea brasiliensis TaxID=3981 RepID=A0ABQ9L524_HEVBR|nr:uncharacterized protein LOC110648692 [Hevea brasiliensis]KAJ9159413.1 hypothetical protein P3X46_024921 [Hevea brasiliensis]
MSRRERDARDSDSRRHRSGFDREPSPKRSRRDGKPVTERVPSNTNLDVEDHADRDQKHRRRLQDALPLEAPSAPDSKVESGAVSKESDKKPNGHHEGSKHSDPTEVPRSRSYFQHDERGNAAQVGRNFGRRAATERQWRDSKDVGNERAMDKSSSYDSRQRDEKAQAKGGDNVWRHDGFFKMEAEPAPPVRKRPAFRETKIPVDSENAEKAASEPLRLGHPDRHTLVSERREERDRNPRHSDRYERPVLGDKKEPQRGSLLSRERYTSGGGGGNYRGRERSSGRQVYRPSGARVEKWKHDLYDEANRSPTTKNEEDQIAKIEELLAS